MLTPIFHSPQLSIYEITDGENNLLHQYIISTPDTRDICNDPQICGVEYIQKLQHACLLILENLPAFNSITLHEHKAVVLNLLNTGVNFGIREALSKVYGWNTHQVQYIPEHLEASSDDSLFETLPTQAQIIFGDVILSPQRIKEILLSLLYKAEKIGTQIQNIVLFTLGSNIIEDSLSEIANECKKKFKHFSGIELFYLEGRFLLANKDTSLRLKKEEKDLVRKDALMAPEFISSQYELPFYPLERCVSYNAKNRADNVIEYVQDIVEYWKEVRAIAMQGCDFETLLKERFPNIDGSKFGKQNLMSLAEQHITKLNRLTQPKENIIE